MLDSAEECDRCPAMTADLTQLGDYLLCPKCFHEAIADLEILPPPIPNARDAGEFWEP
jgi:hypothetical protein